MSENGLDQTHELSLVLLPFSRFVAPCHFLAFSSSQPFCYIHILLKNYPCFNHGSDSMSSHASIASMSYLLSSHDSGKLHVSERKESKLACAREKRKTNHECHTAVRVIAGLRAIASAGASACSACSPGTYSGATGPCRGSPLVAANSQEDYFPANSLHRKRKVSWSDRGAHNTRNRGRNREGNS